MDNTRLPKHALNYKPRGRRARGRPRKRWQYVDAATGQTTKSMEEDDDDEMNLFNRNLDFKPAKKKILLISWAKKISREVKQINIGIFREPTTTDTTSYFK